MTNRQLWIVFGLIGALLLAVAVLGTIRAHAAPDPKVVDFWVSYLGLLANLAMAGAAVWAVRTAVEWRDEMRGKSFHSLALDASAIAHRIERTWHAMIDKWKMLGRVESNPLQMLRGDAQVLFKLDAAIPELVARMDGLCGKGYALPLQALSGHINDLAQGWGLHAEQRDRRANAAQYEPQATIMRARAGYHDFVAAKGWVTDLVAIVSDWAAPHLGSDSAAKLTVEDVERRVAEVHARHEASYRKELETNPPPKAAASQVPE